MRARGHVPDVAHVSRALRETQDSAKCAAPFDADFDAAGDVPEFSAGVEAARPGPSGGTSSHGASSVVPPHSST